MSETITTISFIKYASWWSKLAGFLIIPISYLVFWRTNGLQFFRVMGSGSDSGFSLIPDFSVYAFLVVWKDEHAAKAFYTNSFLMRWYTLCSTERWTIYLRNIQSKGTWAAQAPFISSSHLNAENPIIAVITRATIRWSKMVSFWKYVPTSQKPLQSNKGLLFSKGIGEAPVIQMATFSIWADVESLKQYAHYTPEHQTAMQKTHQLNWYTEELFARFQPYASYGKWNGINPLENYLVNR